MPSDVVSLAVSTGFGVSVFAGIVSGVCYVLVCGLANKRTQEPGLQWLCTVCGFYLRLCETEKIKIIICSNCKHRVCKRRCSRRDSQTKEWICYTCLKQPSFFQGIINSVRLFRKKISSTQSNQMGKKQNNDERHIKEEKESIRDFIEKLVSTILGGSVDDASIFRIYDDEHYNTLFDRYYQDLSDAITNLSSALQISMQNASLSEQSPSSAHTNLKLLIQKILRDAAHLPHFSKPVENPTTTEERTYEELLATAILNKIVDKENASDSSSAEHVRNDRSNIKHRVRSRNKNSKWIDEIESASVSSVDDYVYSDSSHGSSKYVDRFSLTIQQRIEHKPPIDEHDDLDGDFDYYSNGRPSSVIDDTNSNWYLQKRPFHGTASPVPVPMLVPNPLTSAKVLIGDTEIDDTSDLSDANSECDNTEISEIPNLIIDSSLTIEEQKDNYSSDEQTSFDSGVREDRDSEIQDADNFYYPEAKNFVSADEKAWVVRDSSLISSESNVERDTEYFEKYSSLPSKIYITTSSHSLLSDYETNNGTDHRRLQNQSSENSTPLEKDSSSVFEGSYSKKEKEKWRHPVNMAHNPYSEENIQRRIQSNQRYGRDYYTKQASLPSGRAKTDEDNNWWTGEEITVHRAEPVNATDDSLTIEFNNSLEITFDQDEQDRVAPEIDYLNFPSVENQRVVFEGENRVEIRVNKKQVYSPDAEITIGNHTVGNSEERSKPVIRVNEKKPVILSLDDFTRSATNNQDRDIDVQSFKASDDEIAITVNEVKPYIPSEEPKKLQDKTEIGVNIRHVFIDNHDSTIINRNSTTYQKPEIKTRTKVKKNGHLPPDFDPINQSVIEERSPHSVETKVTNTAAPNVVNSAPILSPNEDNVDNLWFKDETNEYLKKEPPQINRQWSVPSTANKKSDNTWIKKIYANPIVRNFALSNREQIPIPGISDEELSRPKSNGSNSTINVPSPKNKPAHVFEKPATGAEYIHLTHKEPQSKDLQRNLSRIDDVATTHNFSLEFSDHEDSPKEYSDKDFEELKDKHLVANLLGQFSKSFPNLVRSQSVKHGLDRKGTIRNRVIQSRDAEMQSFDDTHVENNNQTYFSSVRDLRKLFEKSDVSIGTKDKPVHSLTARSISKEMMQKLSSNTNGGSFQ